MFTKNLMGPLFNKHVAMLCGWDEYMCDNNHSKGESVGMIHKCNEDLDMIVNKIKKDSTESVDGLGSVNGDEYDKDLRLKQWHVCRQRNGSK
jgi:hypothetical protein